MRPTCEKRLVKISGYHGLNISLPNPHTAVGEYTHAQGQFMLNQELSPGDTFDFEFYGEGIVKIQGFGSKSEAQSWFQSKQPLGRGCIRIRTQKTLRYSVKVPPPGNKITLISKTGRRQDQLAGCILAFDIECGVVQVILFKSSNVKFDTIYQSKYVEVSDTLRNCTATLKHYNPLSLCTPLNCSLKAGKIFILSVKGPESERATGSYIRICIAGQHNLYCNQGDEKCAGTSTCPEVKGKRLTARPKGEYEYILRFEDNAVSVERFVREQQKINVIEWLPASGQGDCALWFELHRVSIQLSEYRVKNDINGVDSPPDYPAPPPPIHPAQTLRRPFEGTRSYDHLERCDDLSLAVSSSSHQYISIQVGEEMSSYVSADSETNHSMEETALSKTGVTDTIHGDCLNFDSYDSENINSREPSMLTNTKNNEAGSLLNELVCVPNHFSSASKPVLIPPKPHNKKKSMLAHDQCHINCRTSEKCLPSAGYEMPSELTAFHPTKAGMLNITKKPSCPENGSAAIKLCSVPVRSKSFSPGHLLQKEHCGTRCKIDPLYQAGAESSITERCMHWLVNVNSNLTYSNVFGDQLCCPDASPMYSDENICSASQVSINSNNDNSSFFISYHGYPSEPRISHNINLQAGCTVSQNFSTDTLQTSSIDLMSPPPLPPPIKPRSSVYVNGKLPTSQVKPKIPSESDKYQAHSHKSNTPLKNIDLSTYWSSSASEMSIDEETFAKIPSNKHLQGSEETFTKLPFQKDEVNETFTKLPFQKDEVNELSKESLDFTDMSVVRRDKKITGRNIVESSNINDQFQQPVPVELVTELQPSPIVTLGRQRGLEHSNEKGEFTERTNEQGGFQRSNTFRRNFNTATPPCIKKSYPSKQDLGK